MRNGIHFVQFAIAGVMAVAAGAMTSAPSSAQPAPPSSQTGLEFTTIFGEAINVREPTGGQTFTPAVDAFHASGENLYTGDQEAVAEGEALFARECRTCHGRNASGGMAPSLVDGTYAHERAGTEKGMFELIYGGAAGAMPAFGSRLEQDQMLKIIAYISSVNESRE